MKNVMKNFLISLWFYINFQIVKSIELLFDGEYYKEEQSPHSIYLYTFECESQTRIYLKAEKGNPILYGYATSDEELSITENDIIKLNKFGYLDNSYTISPISYIDYDTEKNLEEDYYLIVYCSDNDINCEYSIWYSEAVNITLKENTNNIFYEKSGHFQIDLSDYQITDNSMLKVYVTPLAGYIYFSNITKNDIYSIQISPTKVKYSINDVYSFKLNDTDKNYTFSYSANINSVFQIRYVIEENEKANKEITITKGTTEIFDITNEEEIIYKIDSSSFKDLFIFDITAHNCEMNIQEIENDNIINEYTTSFYQVLYKKTDSFIIKVKNNKNIEGTSCKLINYGFEKDLFQSLTLLEGVEQKLEFKPEITQFELQFHFHYIKSHSLLVKFNFNESSKAIIKLKVNNQNYIESENDEAIGGFHLLFDDESLSYCVHEKICTITFLLYSASDDNPGDGIISFTMKNIDEKQLYLPKNQMIKDYHFSNTNVFYYTDVTKGEKGEIKWNYINELTDISYCIFEKDNKTLNKTDFFNNTNTTKMDLHRGRLQYYVDEKQYECKNGCELWIYLININLYETKPTTQEILIGIHNFNNNYFIEKVNTIVYNTFPINEDLEFFYLLYLPLEIRKFQVRIYGYNEAFTIVDFNKANECCNNLNKEFISNNDVKFINVDVLPNINTTDYEIKIGIKVSRKSQTEDYFEFEVIPYVLNYPIHYIHNNRKQFCVTDERKKCYFVVTTEEKYKHSLFFFDENNEPILHQLYIINQADEDILFDESLVPDLFEKNMTDSSKLKIVNKENNLYIEEEYPSVRLYITLEFDSPNKTILIGYLCPLDQNFHLSLLKENPIFVFVRDFLLFQPYSYLTTIHFYNILIEILPVQGNGIILYQDNNKLNGPTTILLTEGNFNKTISLLSEFPIVCFLKLRLEQKDNFIIKQFNFNEHNRFFLNSALPFKILSKLEPNEEEIKITISIENLSEKSYNYSNLEILAGYSNNSYDFIPTKTKQIINNNQIAAIDFKLSEEKKNFRYLMLAFNSNQTKISQESNWKIHIVGVSDTKQRKKPPLPQSVYFFNYIDSNSETETQYYYLNKGKAFVIDFATCTNDLYELSASCVYEPKCNITRENPVFKNGVTQYKMYLEKEDFLYVSIKLQKSNEHYKNSKRYYGINYHIYPNLTSVKSFNISQKSYLTTNYNYKNNTIKIKSTWGSINNIEKGELLFNYYLFNSRDYFNESICFIETPVNHTITEQFNEEISVPQKEFDYYSVVIADFVNETKDILVGYNIYNVKYKMSMLWLWLSIIFIFILLFFGFTTFTLYRQIKVTDKRLLFDEKLKQ